MENVRKFLEKTLNIDTVKLTLSGERKKGKVSRIKIRPVKMKGQLLYQVSMQREKQVFHENYDKEALIDLIIVWLAEDFKQLQIETRTEYGTILISKKGKVTVTTKKRDNVAPKVALEHNKKKQYILEEGMSVPFLVDLGVMTKEGKIVHARYAKFRQINRYLEFVRDVLPALPKDRELTIIDFGCGKSYLTFALYYYLKEMKGLPVHIIGLDLKKEVIEECSQLGKKYGYDQLEFLVGDISSFEGYNQVDMVVSLHACDTATDYAIEKAVRWGASVILAVPCCQHEVNEQISCEPLQPILKYGLIQERMASLITDGLRAQILEHQGYDTQILEFIDMEHTPKNILIRSVKTKNKKEVSKELRECMELLHVRPTLYHLLVEDEK